MARSRADESQTLERDAVPDAPRARSALGPDLCGKTLLHFHVVERLGEGGMGIVYKAVDDKLRRSVALKILNARYVADDRNREMLFREARSAAAVSHPNIAAIYDVQEAEGLAFIAMELVRGRTARELIAKGPLEVRVALAYAREIALALAAAHDAGVVHRDLKADNVMIAERGHVKVLDFGIAMVAYGAEVVATPPATGEAPLVFAPTMVENGSVTAVGRVSGTPAYMSPEQAHAEAIDARTDVFAFGVLLYEMLTGSLPFVRGSADPREWGGEDSADWRPARPPRAANRAVPRAIELLISRCLAFDPGARWANGSALVAALDEAARVSRPRWRTAAAIAGGLALVAAITVAVQSRRTETPGASADAPVSAIPAAAAAFDAAMQAWRDGSSEAARRSMRRAVELDPALAAASLRQALWIDLLSFSVIGSVPPDAGHPAYADARNHRTSAGTYDRALVDAFEPRFRPKPDFKETERRLGDLAARFPQRGEVHYWIAVSRSKAGDVRGAVEATKRAVSVEPALGPAVHALRAWLVRGSNESDALLDRCIAIAPAATDCLGQRARARGNAGNCAGMEEDAHAWIAADPEAAYAYMALSEALFAQGVPTNGVHEAFATQLRLVPPDERPTMRAWGEAAFAMGSGDFRAVEAAARAYLDGLGSAPSVSLAFAGTVGLGHPALEAGDRAAVEDVTSRFLDRERARTMMSPPEVAMSVAVLGLARKAGVIAREEFVRERARRRAALDASLADASEDDRSLVWFYAWAGGVETSDDAREAVAALTRFPPLQPPDVMTATRAAIVGAVYLNAGEPARAIPYLRRGAATCFTMNSLYHVMRSRLLLANALVEVGARDEARVLYEGVLARWGKATPRSVSADEAAARLRGL